ncbi:hypothetical protein SNEBB_010426 [Seison nebaliae]|nr:hypothetical protein SNEBB_010426 [Seison nebaliae]
MPEYAEDEHVSSKRLQQTQAQVDEVIGIMRNNVEKVLERDQQISQLDNQADELQAGASQFVMTKLNDDAKKFQHMAKQIKRNFWYDNMKMWLLLIVTLLFIILSVTIYFVVHSHSVHSDGGGGGGGGTKNLQGENQNAVQPPPQQQQQALQPPQAQAQQAPQPQQQILVSRRNRKKRLTQFNFN